MPSSSRMAASPAGHVMPSAASSSLQVSGGKGGGGHWQPPGPHAHWGPSEWGCGSPTPHFPVPLHCSPLHSGCGLHHQPQAHHSGVGDGDGSNAPPPPQSVTVHSSTSFTSDVHTGFHSPAPSSYSRRGRAPGGRSLHSSRAGRRATPTADAKRIPIHRLPSASLRPPHAPLDCPTFAAAQPEPASPEPMYSAGVSRASSPSNIFTFTTSHAHPLVDPGSARNRHLVDATTPSPSPGTSPL